MSWIIDYNTKLLKVNKPVLIVGLPGIGNVGKFTVDFLVEELNAKKFATLFSNTMPSAVFVNEQDLLELPTISLYYVKNKKQDVLLLAGDVQPQTEESCYDFTETILEVFKKLNGSLVITLGGIGLKEVPEKPKLYCSSTSKKFVKSFLSKTNLETKLYGVVGTIMGVSGVLVGMAVKKNIPAITILSETFHHPLYLEVKGAREMVKLLNEKLSLGVNIKNLDKEISNLESETKRKVKALMEVQKEQTEFKEEKSRYIG